MKNKNMTALVSAFVRCYHYKNSKIKIYSDKYSEFVISKDEYNNILTNMSEGIKFFNPTFIGTKDEAIKWIVNNQIGPSVLGRSAFNKKSLETAIKIGCKQYLVFASGYDTSTINQNIKCFEIDKEDIIKDKIKRLNNNHIDTNNIVFISADFTNDNWVNSVMKSSYDQREVSFNSLLGISYYLTKAEFENMIKQLANITCEGSSILFDFQTNEESKETKINEQLALESKEEMKAKYTYQEMEKILEKYNIKIFEYLNNEEMTNKYFYNYNTLNPTCKIDAPKGIGYILAVKK